MEWVGGVGVDAPIGLTGAETTDRKRKKNRLAGRNRHVLRLIQELRLAAGESGKDASEGEE